MEHDVTSMEHQHTADDQVPIFSFWIKRLIWVSLSPKKIEKSQLRQRKNTMCNGE